MVPSPADTSSHKHQPGEVTVSAEAVPAFSAAPAAEGNGDVYTEPLDSLCGLARIELSGEGESSISPYACYYGGPKAALKTGWLDKLSPTG